MLNFWVANAFFTKSDP